jgi:diguanylate cyclase (GGDEF)-like protein
MNLQAILTVNAVGCAMLIVLFISSHIVRERRLLSDKLFTLLIIMTGLACVSEAASFLIDGRSFPFAVPLAKLLNSVLYLLDPLESFVWCVYVDMRLYNSTRRIKRIFPKLFIPVLISAAALVFNLKYGFLFSIDSSNVYHRQPLGYLFYALAVVYIALSMIDRTVYYHRRGKNLFFPIYMFIFPIAVASAVQFAVYGISVVWCAAALGLVGMYMCLQNELSYIDPLTRLYNRNYLDHVIRNAIRRSTRMSGIMIDIDYFKSINDSFGHSVGDEALFEAAELIRKTSPERAIVVRFAGDEFIVLLRNGTLRDADSLRCALRDSTENFNGTSGKQYSLSFSIGCGTYDPAKMSADRFLNVMDDNMYTEKKLKHSSAR